MSASGALQIVIVDDEPDLVLPSFRNLKDGLEVTVLEPDDVTERHLKRADIVLVDYKLDRWPGRDETVPLTLKPMDGVALAGILRSHISVIRPGRTAIALHAADLEELSGGFNMRSREHVIARMHNLEWAFRKSEGGFPKQEQLRSLARGVQQLPNVWLAEDSAEVTTIAKGLLGLSEAQIWSARAWDDVEECRPPIHEIAPTTNGLAFLRWMLHRILPYPTFVYSSVYLAHSLKVTPEPLTRALDQEDERLLERLNPVKYQGVLSGFLGRRWWKSGVEHLIWDLSEGEPFDRDRLALAVTDKLSSTLEPLSLQHPVVCVDQTLAPEPVFVERSEAVELQPDDWPLYAQSPWTSVHNVRRSPSLAALVVEEDRHRLGDGEPHERED